MRIIYPYNEILPKKTAHDVYIINTCAALANLGHQVTLLCGAGSISDAQLFEHYKVDPFTIHRLPILRKNTPLNLSWNLPFFFCSQRTMRKIKPNWVLMSVRKQAHYHLKHKLPSVRYLYEVHELTHYPYMTHFSKKSEKERALLEQADLITVTTAPLKEILQAPPYSITTPIKIIPLAVGTLPLPPPIQTDPLTLMYIGQLYAGQGISFLLQALARTDGMILKIIGGKTGEIDTFKQLAHTLNIHHRVHFLGFIPPKELPDIAKEAHAFVAPFDQSGRMPYVAHTKLFEYASWGRPLIAPKLSTVESHFTHEKGVLLYPPDNIETFISCLNQLKNRTHLDRLQKEIERYKETFSWKYRAQKYENLLL